MELRRALGPATACLQAPTTRSLCLDAASVHERIRVPHSDDDAANPGGADRGDAGSGSSLVRARLERRNEGLAAGAIPRFLQRAHLGVRLPGARMEASPHDGPAAQRYGADAGVGVRGAHAAASQTDRGRHGTVLGLGEGVQRRAPRFILPCCRGPNAHEKCPTGRHPRGARSPEAGRIRPMCHPSPIQTMTVGSGISPGSALRITLRLAGFHRRWGLSPRPEGCLLRSGW